MKIEKIVDIVFDFVLMGMDIWLAAAYFSDGNIFWGCWSAVFAGASLGLGIYEIKRYKGRFC